MSPHRVDLLPLPSALASYGISVNGFLPTEAPLRRLSDVRYRSWESLIDRLPELLESGFVRKVVDMLPVLDVSHLENEQELQRAYSLLAMIAQAYIWQGPEPSEVR
jgi:indoleamine 2,3-dioxygenase